MNENKVFTCWYTLNSQQSSFVYAILTCRTKKEFPSYVQKLIFNTAIYFDLVL